MRILFASAVLMTALAASASAADTYSFTTTGTSGATVGGAGPGGTPVFGGMSTFENKITDSVGKVTTGKGTCAAWSAQPGDNLQVHGVCNSDGDTGKTNVFFSCTAADKNGNSMCWGYLTSSSGKYAGRTGTASWSNHSNGPGKGSTGAGAGVWN